MIKHFKHPAQTKAEDLLLKLCIETVPIPVERVAKSLGAQVRFTPFEGDLSGLIYREEDEDGRQIATIIGVNSTHSPTRRRFTLAHEIGHLYLEHLDTDAFGQLHIDRKFHIGTASTARRVLERGARAALGVDMEEMAANAFAAALLMPEKALRADFDKLHDVSFECFDYEDDELASSLAKRYNVSLQAMLIRLSRLGLIQDFQGTE